MTRARHYNTMIAMMRPRSVSCDESTTICQTSHSRSSTIGNLIFPIELELSLYINLPLIYETKVTRFIIRKMMRRKSERAMIGNRNCSSR